MRHQLAMPRGSNIRNNTITKPNDRGRKAVDRFLASEHELVLDYRDELQRASPFRENPERQSGKHAAGSVGGT